MIEDTRKIPWPELSLCLETIGTSAFIPHVSELLTGPLSVMQCMVFAYDNKHMKCMLSLNFQREELAVPLGGAYINDGYKNDPNMQQIQAAEEGRQHIVRLSDVTDRLSAAYREKYFNRPGIVDKVSHIRRYGNRTFYINFYRGQAAGPIESQDLLADDDFIAFLSSLLTRHFESSDPRSQTGPLTFLSNREQQVCNAILKGQKTEQIAHGMGLSPHTVTTYRKRAYQKLGISSRGELFLLCT